MYIHALITKFLAYEKNYWETILLIALIGTKIVMSGFTCPSCNSGSTCVAWVGNSQFSFANWALQDGWYYTISVKSDTYCQSYTMSNTQNGGLGSASGFQVNFPIGKPFQITIEARSPCSGFSREYYIGSDNWLELSCPAGSPATTFFDEYCYSKGLIGC